MLSLPSSMFISYICVNCPYWERALILEWLREGAPGEEMWIVCNPYIRGEIPECRGQSLNEFYWK